MTLSQQDRDMIARLTDLEAKTTSGPWEIFSIGSNYYPGIDSPMGSFVLYGIKGYNDEGGIRLYDGNAAFIAESRNAIPRLLEIIKELLKFKSELATKDAKIAELREAISETHEELWKCWGFIGNFANKGHPYAVAALRAQLVAAEASNKELREALEPFAKEAKYYDPGQQYGRIIDDDLAFSNDSDDLNVGDLRRARAALRDKPK